MPDTLLPTSQLAAEPTRTKPRSKWSLSMEGRWRWWYSSIADLMILEPNLTQKEIAARLDKSELTICSIVGTDLFRSYLAQRKLDLRAQNEAVLSQKMTKVAEASLDLVLDKLEKKRDQVPLDTLKELSVSMLDRLGYAPSKGPTVQINAQTNNTSNPTVLVPVSADALSEARDALRLAERRRAETAPPLHGVQAQQDGLLLELKAVDPEAESDDPFAGLGSRMEG